MIFFNKNLKSVDSIKKFISDEKYNMVIECWASDFEEHTFKDSKKGNASAKALFKKAIDRAIKNSPDIPTIFQRKNLKFITKANKRLPTLYFINEVENESGRIRQQHRSGPLVKIAQNEHKKIDYFFSSMEEKNDFTKRARILKNSKRKFYPLLEFGAGIISPRENYYHVEITYNNQDLDSVEVVHPSEGRVKTKLNHYNDENISSIYCKTIGIRCSGAG